MGGRRSSGDHQPGGSEAGPCRRPAGSGRQRPAAAAAARLSVWAGAVIGYAVLLGCELRWPRWRYDIRRWATVFPMGMTAAASFAVARAERLPALAVFGDILLWPGLAAWALTVVAAAGWLQGSRARRETKSSGSAPSRGRPSRRER